MGSRVSAACVCLACWVLGDMAVAQPLSLLGRDGQAIAREGEFGLWQLRFRDGTVLSAADVPEAARNVTETPNGARMSWDAEAAEVTVTSEVDGRGAVLHGEVTPKRGTVLEFALPARLRFTPEEVERLICPADGNFGVGWALNSSFFREQLTDSPSGWTAEAAGPAGYEALYGGPLQQRADVDPPVVLRPTPDGETWLGADVARRIAGAQGVVNRPPATGQADLVLADSDNGPYLSAKRLGEGMVWRVGGAVRDEDASLVAAMVGAVATRLAEGSERPTIGLVALRSGPERGGWAAVRIRVWRDTLRAAAERAGRQLTELDSPASMVQALAEGRCVAVLNPYGEQIPVPDGSDTSAVVAAIRSFVAAGGNWFEVGGYPFFYAMRPQRFLSYGYEHPAGFADFLHIDSLHGSLSVYGVQPRDWAPWSAASDTTHILVPSRSSCGGDARGGHAGRAFITFAPVGQTWHAPPVRLLIGEDVPAALRAYCEDNGIRRRLDEKMPPETLARFKRAVLLYYGGNAQEKTRYLDRLPVPTLIHFADYLKGGFDKQYPDHLPPHPSFGTPEELKRFFDRAHELGHLVMPYTNPTWWCDHPRGPTFEREGEAPLLRQLDGNLSYELYAANDGYTVCHWHPAVRAANDSTVRQFTEEFPVDVLFQDQNGARGFRYDLNPASPTPYAYTEGLLSMVGQDSRVVPLSTEAGWDGVVNFQSQLCGLSWGLVPTEGGPEWRTLMRDQYPPGTFTVYPVAQYIAHDKCAMLYHDLGQFVTNREVLSWALGLGFSLSYRMAAVSLDDEVPTEWLRWLDRVQGSVCARYVGEPVRGFEHDRSAAVSRDDDGVIRADYGPVHIVANLGPVSRETDGLSLPPYGFVARASGVEAGCVQRIAGRDYGDAGLSYVVEEANGQREAWVYAPARTEVAIPWEGNLHGEIVIDGAARVPASTEGGALVLTLPDRPGEVRVSPPERLAGLPPVRWPGGVPAVGVLNVPGLVPVWTRVSPGDWLASLQGSALAKDLAVPIRPIDSVEALVAALTAGPEQWLAIVNPYGEGFPAEGEGQWRDMLNRIRTYVQNGGCWWETGGFSFHGAYVRRTDRWELLPVGPAGIAGLDVPVGGGDVEQAPEPLRVSEEGVGWLTDASQALVARSSSAVNRGLPADTRDPGHVTVITGPSGDFVGGYRLAGWGWLWRIGGLNPDPQVSEAVVADVLARLASSAPLPPKPPQVRRLWHLQPAA